MHAYQMNLAADVITRENIEGEDAAIAKNLEVARSLRANLISNKGTPPEDLPLLEPISSVRRRVTGKRTKSASTHDLSDATASPQLPLQSPSDAREK
jgi:hypothetical protein